MKRPLLALGASAAVLFLAALPAWAQETRALVELYTSQGCNSCPAADKLFGELARDRSLIAVSQPVDYWDYLGWKDTLARPRHTARQRGYASVRGDRQVYTPQAVVNGAQHAVGSDRDAIEAAIARTRGEAPTLTVPVQLAITDKDVTIQIKPRKEAEAVAEVWLWGISQSVTVAIKRGENKGKTVTYHNVVRQWINVGNWTGGSQSWTVPRSELKAEPIDSVVVVVQGGGVQSPGAIMGAAHGSLR